MAQFRGGQSGYGIGTQAPFGGSSEEKTDSNPLDAIREQTSKIEDMLDTLSEPIKP
jgi:ER-derived vesicles protein